MRFVRFLPVLAASLAVLGALSAPAAFATRSVWARDGEPTCTVTITSASSSSTSCTGMLSGLNGVTFDVNLVVNGSSAYQCQDSTGAVTPGQTQVRAATESTTTFTPTKKNPTFTTPPAILTAPTTVVASQAGCADGATPVDPTLATTKLQLTLAPAGDQTVLLECASDPSGLSGTVVLSGC